MRRLPIYLVIDTSGSMAGEPIQAVNNGLQTLVSVLRQDPYALESAYISVISFAEDVVQEVPLTDLCSFNSPTLYANGATNFGKALQFLSDTIDREVVKSTLESKGDWKPLVFIMTDGCPSDSTTLGISKFKACKLGGAVAFAVGSGADQQFLKTVTETVMALETADSNSIKALFKWVSASISVGSQKIDSGSGDCFGDSRNFPVPPPEMNMIV